ncbi:uncharacterized protein CC84DRAFT_1228406 [Paraphaeosphaeria sporulosa]|uniref:Rhodopsin domain-containing protein n=1 Tax=Paraphaeosphaeria sporulosa TaxID=1460663 RepID=A0A177C3C3_9PLEO|nr:uncharacterized protein CC84DRAFT_1228406 [Paraphaeosphaeria sporulosa]OAG01382.1 hypothetical protein CC84DRAFT_1228406 [Paraphaeosphaeria sporulosa]
MQGVVPPPLGVSQALGIERTELQKQSIVAYTTLTTVATIFVFLRLYTRLYLRASLGWDDALVLLSWIGCVAWIAICMSALQYGFGEHMWNVTPLQFAQYLQLLIGISIVYVWTPALSKLSLLALYHRILPDIRSRVGVYTLFVLILGYNLGITITIVGPCNLLKHSDPTCLMNANLVMAILNIMTDVCIIVMPTQILYRLQMDRKQKWFIGIIFFVASGVIIISIVRIIYVYKYVGEVDVTYYQAAAALFSTAELNVGIICTSMVGLKPFIDACRAFIYEWWKTIKDSRVSEKPLIDDGRTGLDVHDAASCDEETSRLGAKHQCSTR